MTSFYERTGDIGTMTSARDVTDGSCSAFYGSNGSAGQFHQQQLLESSHARHHHHQQQQRAAINDALIDPGSLSVAAARPALQRAGSAVNAGSAATAAMLAAVNWQHSTAQHCRQLLDCTAAVSRSHYHHQQAAAVTSLLDCTVTSQQLMDRMTYCQQQLSAGYHCHSSATATPYNLSNLSVGAAALAAGGSTAAAGGGGGGWPGRALTQPPLSPSSVSDTSSDDVTPTSRLPNYPWMSIIGE